MANIEFSEQECNNVPVFSGTQITESDWLSVQIRSRNSEGSSQVLQATNFFLEGAPFVAKPEKPPKVEENKFEAVAPKPIEQSKPGDNRVRDLNWLTDNPKAVEERYGKMVDGLGLSPAESLRLKDQFGKDLEKMQGKFMGGDMSRILRSMNLLMDQNNHLGNDKNRVNAVAGLAARVEPQEANRQGANPTCALTSESRIEQQRNFVRYAEQMGSVAARGGAWRGGENGSKAVWVNVDAKGTNHANFVADSESGRMYDKDYHQSKGHRDYLGQIDNALIGGEMAIYAGQKDGRDYVYVAANSHMVRGAAHLGQSGSGNTLMERSLDGQLSQVNESGYGSEAWVPKNGPPSSSDMVAAVNQANGGGGLYIPEFLAAQYRRPDGSYPAGMNVFKDAADLKKQLATDPGKEYQFAIVTAGGLHAQTVQINRKGQLEFGNNWAEQLNLLLVPATDRNNQFLVPSPPRPYTLPH